MTKVWPKNAVIYQIFIDRFAGFNPASDDMKPDFCGGNIRGITEKLPYIKDLGADAVWLSPFLQTADYHGYSTTDFYKVDPHFGTLEDLKVMAAECQKLGLKIILDFNTNHTSNQHPFFQEALSNPDSEYRNWYYFDAEGGYRTFLSFGNLPKLNLEYAPARDHVTESAKYWIQELGADGLRLDHAVGPNKKFWQYFVSACKSVNPNLITLGEVGFFGVHYSNLKSFEMAGIRWLWWRSRFSRNPLSSMALKPFIKLFDGCLDFTFLRILQHFGQGKLTRAEVNERLRHHYEQFPDNFLLPAFLSNQDKNRYLFMAGQDYNKAKEAVEILFSVNQPKIIYYGDEVGMSHTQSIVVNSGWAGDLACRRKMNWQPNPQEKELLGFYKEQIAKSKLDNQA